MTYRRGIALALFALSLLVVPAARADEDDPVFRGKMLSEWLQMLQEDKDPNHRQAAIIALQLIGPNKSRKVLPALVSALRDDGEPKVRARAGSVLGALVEKAIRDKNTDVRLPPLRDALAAAVRADKSDQVREAAARALGMFEKEGALAVSALAVALEDKHEGTRAAAADALRRIGKDAAEALPALQKVLADKTAGRLTRIQCALAIGRIGAPDGLAALSTLKEVLADTKANSEVRKAAAETLGRFGRDAADAVPTLASTLASRDSNLTLRRAVVNTLDDIGPSASEALPSLQGALKDEDKFVRSASLHTIGQLGSAIASRRKKVVDAVLTCMDDNALEVRIAAIDTLATLGPEALGDQLPGVVQRLTETMSDSEKVIRDAATQALKKLQGKH
jgi:HEAT repeat protein